MNNIFKYSTDYLFAMPNALTGAATVINLAGNFYGYNESATGSEADEKALESDFNVVGQDISSALEGISEEFEFSDEQ
ncbi:MAG: hypothetical protein LAT52_10660 [Balneolales bacterium]|nr:hypothetical protein [Balneolales bacterium]